MFTAGSLFWSCSMQQQLWWFKKKTAITCLLCMCVCVFFCVSVCAWWRARLCSQEGRN